MHCALHNTDTMITGAYNLLGRCSDWRRVVRAPMMVWQQSQALDCLAPRCFTSRPLLPTRLWPYKPSCQNLLNDLVLVRSWDRRRRTFVLTLFAGSIVVSSLGTDSSLTVSPGIIFEVIRSYRRATSTTQSHYCSDRFHLSSSRPVC